MPFHFLQIWVPLSYKIQLAPLLNKNFGITADFLAMKFNLVSVK